MSEQLFEVLERFRFHPATEVTGPIHDNIRAVFMETAEWIIENQDIPESREKSLAVTALQQSMMWCNAAVAIHTVPLGENQLPPNLGAIFFDVELADDDD
jgi:DUF438 domain-containing protein